MICLGKNIANCSKKPQFICVIFALCRHAPLVKNTFLPAFSTNGCFSFALLQSKTLLPCDLLNHRDKSNHSFQLGAYSH